MNREQRKQRFIKKAIKKHGGKYGYELVEYINSRTKVTIICPNHGEFKQTPAKHLSGCGCPKCGGPKKLTINEFKQKAIAVHNGKYIYDKVKYINNRTKVTIICPDHGKFEQRPTHHLKGHGCPRCGIKRCAEYQRLDTNTFIMKAIKKHGGKYIYDKVDYVNTHTKVIIICPEHGEFEQTPA